MYQSQKHIYYQRTSHNNMLSVEDIHEAMALLNTSKVRAVLQDDMLNHGLKTEHVKSAQESIKQNTPLKHLLTDKDLIKRISVLHLKMSGLYKE